MNQASFPARLRSAYAMSGHKRAIHRGEVLLVDTPPRRSGEVTGLVGTDSQADMRVRFPSPAPLHPIHSKSAGQKAQREIWPDQSGAVRYRPVISQRIPGRRLGPLRRRRASVQPRVRPSLITEAVLDHATDLPSWSSGGRRVSILYCAMFLSSDDTDTGEARGMNEITATGEPATELERLIAELSESGLLVFVFGSGWVTAHLTGTTRPLFRGPADRRWWHVELGDEAASWIMDVRVDEITGVRFVREPYRSRRSPGGRPCRCSSWGPAGTRCSTATCRVVRRPADAPGEAGGLAGTARALRHPRRIQGRSRHSLGFRCLNRSRPGLS